MLNAFQVVWVITDLLIFNAFFTYKWKGKNITLHEIYTKLKKNLKGEEVSRSHEAL